MAVNKEDETIIKLLEDAQKRFPQKTALVYLNKSFTYAKLKDLIDRFAAGLAALGVGKDDKAILYLPNTPQFIIAFYALIEIGAVPVPVSPIYTPHEVGYIAKDCEAKAIICTDTNFGYVKEVQGRSDLKIIIHTNLIDMLPLWKKVIGFGLDIVPRGKTKKGAGVYRFSDLLKHPPLSRTVEISTREDICRLLYTGGTTGLPKGLPSCHALLYYGARELSEVAGGTEITQGNSRIVITLPLYHALTQAVFTGLILTFGNTAIVMPQPQVDAILACIERYKADLFLGVGD